MRVIIPVAGVGSRLRPHTYTLPKVLLNVAGKPVLGHILEELQQHNIRQCTIIIGYRGDLVQEYVTKHFDLDVTFITQEERLGLGHSIWIARNTVDDNEPLGVVLGDTVFDFNLKNFFSSEQSCLGVKTVDDPRRFGVAETNDDGLITKLVEKPEVPQSNLALVGLYFVKKAGTLMNQLDTLIANDIRTRGEYQLTDALQMMIEDGEEFRPYPIEGWYDCGKPETLLSTNRFLLERYTQIKKFPDSIIIPPVYISPSAKIERSIIGPNATIADNVHVSDSIIKDSIISDNAHVHHTVLEESIIGNNAGLRGHSRKINIGDSSEVNFL